MSQPIDTVRKYLLNPKVAIKLILGKVDPGTADLLKRVPSLAATFLKKSNVSTVALQPGRKYGKSKTAVDTYIQLKNSGLFNETD